jgi:hypothetical protein
VAEATARQALAALERAYDRVVLAMRLPAPLADGGLGGTDGLDLYLTAGAEAQLNIGQDPSVLGPFDQASAFCRLEAPEQALLDRAATLCVGEAIASRLDPAEGPHLRRSLATQLWLVTGRPSFADLAAVDEVQSNPQVSIASRARSRSSEGAAIFLEFLGEAFSATGPGVLETSVLSIAAGATAPAAFQWDNEPDIFDVLRRTLDDKPRRMAELMSDFAVARAFVGTRDDGAHLPTLDWTGSFGRVRFDWALDLSSLPRRVAARYPVEPTGSIYVWLGIDQAVPVGTVLGFRAEWEPPVAFSWVLVRVGAGGEELSRVTAPIQAHATLVEQTLEDLQDVAGVLVVGVNLGGVDPAHPFDPDVEPFEAHSCTVYLTKL